MRDFARYNRFFLLLSFGLGFPLAGCLFLAGIYFEPLDGELTRLGWYSERDFGWNRPQRGFDHPLFAKGQYDSPSEVLVIGDSFSNGWSSSHIEDLFLWENYFVSKTGLSVTSLNYNHFAMENRNIEKGISAIISGNVFKTSPPKVLILEVIERDMVVELATKSEDCQAGPDIREWSVHLAQTKVGETREVVRAKATPDAINVGYARKYFLNRFARAAFGLEASEVVKLKLVRSDLFSNRKSEDILIYHHDIVNKSSVEQQQVEQVRCALARLRNKVQANGKTRFVFMAAPDKLTAYSDYLADSRWAGLSKLDEYSENSAIPFLRVDRILKAAISEGAKDVYLSNDTHWSDVGNRLAGKAMADFVRALR
jgi:hypothetical protein